MQEIVGFWRQIILISEPFPSPKIALLGNLITVDFIECPRGYHNQRHKQSQCNAEKNHIETS
jgi:hypothetical protein